MQTWCGNDDFFYCHWVAESEDDVYKQLYAFELEGTVVNSRVSELNNFLSALTKIFKSLLEKIGGMASSLLP